MALTLALFARAAGYDFVNWDDNYNIATNPNLRRLDWTNVKGIFTSHVFGTYNPLTTLSFALEKHFFGLTPQVYHASNILLHLICVFLAYRLTRLLGMPTWGASVVATLYGVHPMRIESVAWVTERKDVLYGALYFGALIQYVRWVGPERRTRYLLRAIVLGTLSVLAKIQAVALPLSMLAIDHLLDRPLRPRRLTEKWMFFALSLTFGLIGLHFLSQQGALDSETGYTAGQRLLVGAFSFGTYVVKLLAPYRISPLYPYPHVLSWPVYASPILLVALAWLAWVGFRRRWRPLVFGLAFFTANVVFVLQVVGAGQGFLADRFTYVPYYGLLFALVYYGTLLIRSWPRYRAWVLCAAGLWVAALLIQSWRHVPLWRDSGTLWTHVLTYHDRVALPFRNRAQHLREIGEYDLALRDYDRAIALERNPDVINGRARLYFLRAQWDQAIADYDLAIELKPSVGEFWTNRGAAHAMKGELRSALRDMTEGVRRDPTFANGYKNRSLVYQRLGEPEKALEDFQRYLQIDPYDPDVWYESGKLHRVLGNDRGAIESFTRAVRLNPNQGFYYLERARSHLTLGNRTDGRADLDAAEARGVAIDAELRSAYR